MKKLVTNKQTSEINESGLKNPIHLVSSTQAVNFYTLNEVYVLLFEIASETR